jgi:hypothetical protein
LHNSFYQINLVDNRPALKRLVYSRALKNLKRGSSPRPHHTHTHTNTQNNKIIIIIIQVWELESQFSWVNSKGNLNDSTLNFHEMGTLVHERNTS